MKLFTCAACGHAEWLYWPDMCCECGGNLETLDERELPDPVFHEKSPTSANTPKESSDVTVELVASAMAGVEHDSVLLWQEDGHFRFPTQQHTIDRLLVANRVSMLERLYESGVAA